MRFLGGALEWMDKLLCEGGRGGRLCFARVLACGDAGAYRGVSFWCGWKLGGEEILLFRGVIGCFPQDSQGERLGDRRELCEEIDGDGSERRRGISLGEGTNFFCGGIAFTKLFSTFDS